MVEATTSTRIVDATPRHAPFLAWVMLTAARSHLPVGLWDMWMRGDQAKTLAFLEALTTTPQPHWAHHSIFIVAEVEGEPAAALSGYIHEERSPATALAAVPDVARQLGLDYDALMQDFVATGAATIANLEPAHKPDAWVVEHVATAPAFRRQGHIDRLMQAILEKGRARGASVADIGVLIGNDNAQRAYEKSGFRVVNEQRDASFEAAYGCPGIRELTRAI
jgi:ribosomal protein S18 acetylase RimI-like enzyme